MVPWSLYVLPSLLFTGLHLGIFPAPSVILWTLFIISEDSRFFCVLLLFPYFYCYSLALNNIENWNTNSNSPSCECSHMDRVGVVNNLPAFLISAINQLLFSATTGGLEIGSFACLECTECLLCPWKGSRFSDQRRKRVRRGTRPHFLLWLVQHCFLSDHWVLIPSTVSDSTRQALLYTSRSHARGDLPGFALTVVTPDSHSQGKGSSMCIAFPRSILPLT